MHDVFLLNSFNFFLIPICKYFDDYYKKALLIFDKKMLI